MSTETRNWIREQTIAETHKLLRLLMRNLSHEQRRHLLKLLTVEAEKKSPVPRGQMRRSVRHKTIVRPLRPRPNTSHSTAST
jgi:hypothetical protein